MEGSIKERLASMRTRREDLERAEQGAEESPWSRRGLFFAVVYASIYVLWTLFGSQNAAAKKLVSDLVSPATAFVAVVWSVWGVRERRRTALRGLCGTARGGWAANFLTLSIAGYGLGAALWAYYELVLHEAPFPSWADAAYLAGALSMMAGILLLPGRPVPALVRVRVLLDSLMIMAALMTFSWFFILGPTVLNAEGSFLGKALGAAYPCMDLAMLFCILILSARSQEASIIRVRNLLCASVLAYICADATFLHLTLQGNYQAGNPFDAGWMLANLLTCQGALTLRKLATTPTTNAALPAKEANAAPSLWRSFLPYALVPAVGALMIYAWRTHIHGGLGLGVQIGAGLLIALIMARQVFAILENSRLNRFLQDAYRELEALATTDGMTGLPNHRVFQERLRKEIGAAETSGSVVSLLLVDVDRFKAYNDSFGHPAGDEALRIVARLLRESVRLTDLPARYGGEEFAVILPNTDLGAAAHVAERIRAACENHEFPCRAVTLSIGVASCAGRDSGAVIEVADRALYVAKHAGRNGVVVEDRMPACKGRALPEGWSLQAGAGPLEAPSDDVLDGLAGPLIRTMLAMLNLRDQDVERHSDRVMRYCMRLAEEAVRLGTAEIAPAQMADLHLGALLHDIGKVGVPDAILHKPGALTPAEWKVVRQHPIAGADLLADIPTFAGAVPVVRSHHERWDGTGYPDGLAGKSIPLGARLFALADTLDAMWSDRPYRAALEYSAIREEICRMSGVQFDPALVEAFLSVPRSEWESLRSGDEPARTAA